MTLNERFASPEFDCDVIMKGGITSGIVYPPALAEIATDHRLHSIGGTSAGAIGAAVAAAAELGRRSQTGGYARLAQLPDELAQVDRHGRTKLFGLFQAQPSTRSSFSLIWNFRRRSKRTRVPGALVDVARMAVGVKPISTPIIALGSVALAVIVAVLAGPFSLIVGVPLALVGIVVAGAVRILHLVPSRLADNCYGLCNGSTPDDSDDPAVTDWLHEQIQRLAGRHDDGVDEATRRTPVTFGELARSDIDLVVLSTNLTRGTSETVPFRDAIWAYDPDELGRLFPDEVMDHLATHSTMPPFAEQAERLAELGLKPLPPNDQLPIVVAARMSLAFPVLLSAVPLYGYTPKRTGDRWVADYPKNWFSDGGITSNLPVQMFDAYLPGRPTYAINLSGGAVEGAADESVNVWRPITSGQGSLPPSSPIESLGGLLGAVFDTMQNWADNDNSRAVGFRDRICTIRLGETEGGMNLDMPPERIRGLVARGTAAGDNLASMQRGVLRSAGPEMSENQADVVEHQWERHQWIRFRMAISGLAQLVRGMGERWGPDDESSGYRLLSESVSPDGPRWQSYRSDWSRTRADAYRAALDAELASRDLSDDWLDDQDPRGFSLGFGPDRGAGGVRVFSEA